MHGRPDMPLLVVSYVCMHTHAPACVYVDVVCLNVLVRLRVRMCVRACIRACVCVCVW